ncbi:MAG: AAA family ATPase [Chloroflexota bacterium]
MNRELQQIQEALLAFFRQNDLQAKVEIKKINGIRFNILIVTKQFQNLDIEQRVQLFESALQTEGLALNSSRIGLYLLYEPDEYEELESDNNITFEYTQSVLPFWSDTLLTGAVNSENQIAEIPEENPKRPITVTFYSFKGGVGRTTALAIVARELVSQGRRVVAVDFDLEAPGLASLFQIPTENTLGLLDYLHQRLLYPDSKQPDIADCIRRVELQGNRGDLYIVPAGEFNENYIHRLADLNTSALYKPQPSLLDQFRSDLIRQLDPDIILIDARTGLNDLSGLAVLDLADLVLLCFAPNSQGRQGMHWIVNAIQARQRSQRPDLNYRFVLTPFPQAEPIVTQPILEENVDWIAQHQPLNNTFGPEDLEELYVTIGYDPRLPIRESFKDSLPEDLVIRYKGMADYVTASLPLPKAINPEPTINRDLALQELSFTTPIAGDIKKEDLQIVFQRTSDFDEFVNERTTLIRGAKGTGKTMLFRLFVEFPEEAKRLAKIEEIKKDTKFISGHGLSGNNLEIKRDSFSVIENKLGNQKWSLVWRVYAIIKLWHSLEQEGNPSLELHNSLQAEVIRASKSQTDLVEALCNIVSNDMAATIIYDQLKAINSWLEKQSSQVWLLYDDLDAVGGGDNDLRLRALGGLFAGWLELAPLKAIQWKFFVREDLWKAVSTRFTNASHYTGHEVTLSWTESDLWRLVLRQAISNSKEFQRAVKQRGLQLENLEELDENLLRVGLRLLWGERMGGGKAAFTHRWILGRIKDAQGNSFPRSLIELLSNALRFEKTLPKPSITLNHLIRSNALIKALPDMSKARVQALGEEYPNIPEWLNSLSQSESPISEEDLKSRWNVPEDESERRISALIDAGVMKLRERERQEHLGRRYNIAELYRMGIGMLLRGPYGSK